MRRSNNRCFEGENRILDTYDELLLQARSFLEQENFRMAILEAVIGLEIVVSSIVGKIASEEGISAGDTENFLLRVGPSDNLKIILRLLVPESLPNDEVISGCKSAITIRNSIVHKERFTVSKKEAEDAITKIEIFISKVTPLIVM